MIVPGSVAITEYISGSNHSHTIDKQCDHGFNYYSIRGYAVRISEYKPAGLIAKQTESEAIASPQAGLLQGSSPSQANECSTASVVPPIVVDVVLRVGPCI